MWDKLKEQLNIMKIEKKRLCLISNSDKFETKEEFIDAIASALQGGVEIVQLDEKYIPDNVLVDISNKVRALCSEFGATFIINSRADIVQISDADGIHLEQDSIGISDARSVLGEHAIIGITISSVQDAVNAFNDGADYLMMNLDIDALKNENSQEFEDYKWIKENIDIPLFVAGNITADNISGYIQSGIKQFAVSDSIMYASVPEETSRKLLNFFP